MNERTKLGAAVVGGYVLGRTKQGGRALRTFMWLTGSTGGPETVSFAKENVTKVLATEQAKAITDQVKGPLQDAVRQAVMNALLTQVTGLSESLANRTQKLTGDIEGTVDDATSNVTGLLGNKGGKDEESESDNDEEQEEDDSADESDAEDRKDLRDKSDEEESASPDEEEGDGDAAEVEGEEEGEEPEEAPRRRRRTRDRKSSDA